MPTRYLLTGAAGFIGSNVARQLLAAGNQVVGIDNLNDAYDPQLKKWRLAEIQQSPGFEFQSLDITDRSLLHRLFVSQSEPFAAVINLAARAGVRPSVVDPWIYFQTNTDGTLNLLDLCRRFQVAKFVLASTSSLYGGHNPIPFDEETDTNRPLSPYAASKKAAEAIAYTYHHLHGIDVSILRYFTVYGPAGRPDMSIFRFIRAISEGQPITVFGNGLQQRDFTYVDDIACGTIAALRPLAFEVMNLGGDRPVVLNEIIERIASLVGRRPTIIHRPAHPADVPATRANIEKAKRLLSWQPQVTIDQGLEQTVAWYQTNRDLARSIHVGDD